jgi:hypothetical protein
MLERKQAESEGSYAQDVELVQEEVAISEPVFPPDVRRPSRLTLPNSDTHVIRSDPLLGDICN